MTRLSHAIVTPSNNHAEGEDTILEPSMGVKINAATSGDFVLTGKVYAIISDRENHYNMTLIRRLLALCEVSPEEQDIQLQYRSPPQSLP